jgi:transcriptional regulator with PAS, ATPase and Fis domain
MQNGIFTRDVLYGILDNTDVSLSIAGADGELLWMNQACEELFQIQRADVIGLNVEQLEEEGAFNPSVAHIVVKSGKRTSLVHRNSRGKRILSTAIPITDECGRISMIVTTSRDISELISLQNNLECESGCACVERADKYDAGGIIAVSHAMREALHLAARLAGLDSTVLITGESGVGKGVIAEFLHRNGPRKKNAFVKVNCGAIPENLIESELFGYENGAFTGSRSRGKEGLFEAANGGTIFLDEISELPLNLQVKLLQVIQDRTVTRVGGVKEIAVDVRIISATNKSLFALIGEGKFREDLYYRLNVVPVFVPPLRDRTEDIVPLIERFIGEISRKTGEYREISPEAMELLAEYRWPGNVRELQNIIERLTITTSNTVIEPENLPGFIREMEFDASALDLDAALQDCGLKTMLEETEKAILSEARERYGSTRAIARALRTTQPTIVRKMKKYGM